MVKKENYLIIKNTENIFKKYKALFGEQGFDLSQIFPFQRENMAEAEKKHQFSTSVLGGFSLGETGPSVSQIKGALGFALASGAIHGTVRGGFKAFPRQQIDESTGNKYRTRNLTGEKLPLWGEKGKAIKFGPKWKWQNHLATGAISLIVSGWGINNLTAGELSVDSKKEGSALSWLVAGSVLFSKITEEEAVMVVPLTKGGKPIVSGLDTTDPLMHWRNAMGKVTNVFADTLEGSTDLAEEYQSFGNYIWRYVTSWGEVMDPHRYEDSGNSAEGFTTKQL